jgi:hypothetical protein
MHSARSIVGGSVSEEDRGTTIATTTNRMGRNFWAGSKSANGGRSRRYRRIHHPSATGDGQP